MKFEYPAGATPIDADEAQGLIPAHLTLQRELNEFESANILEASDWLFSRRRGDPLDEYFLHAVHRRMFQHVWRWAGTLRRSDKNIGVHWVEIPVRLRQLLDDTRAQIQHHAFPDAEIAVRFHHRLVAVHVYPNGNGRHARLMADLLMSDLSGRCLDWGRHLSPDPTGQRWQYLDALRSADSGHYEALLKFAID